MSFQIWKNVANVGRVKITVDSMEHAKLIGQATIRYKKYFDLSGLYTGDGISFANPPKQSGKKLGYSIPAALHGTPYQNATRISGDVWDVRKANYRLPKRK